MTDPLLFLLAVATLLATPGPTNTLLATAGATSGLRRSLVLLVAELSGYAIAIAVVRLVLAPVLRAYPLLASGLKLAVAAYLVWLAVKIWRRAAALTSDRPVSFANVFVTTLFNPKALIFALSIIPLSDPNLIWFFAGFALLVPMAGFGWLVLGRLVGKAAGSNALLLPRVASVALVGFAGLIAGSAL